MEDFRQIEDKLLRERLEVEKLEDHIRTLTQDGGSSADKHAVVIGRRGQGTEAVQIPASRASVVVDDSGNSASGGWSGAASRRPGTATPSVGYSVGGGSRVRRARSASPVNFTPSLHKALHKSTMGIGDRFRTARVADPGPGSYNSHSAFAPARVHVRASSRVCITADEALARGQATETDIDAAQFATRYGLPPKVVTELLELVQRATFRSRDVEEPFALTHKALLSRVSDVEGCSGPADAPLTGFRGVSSLGSSDADASKRERQLRIDLSNAQRSMQQQQQTATQYQAQMQAQIVQLRQHIATLKADAVEAVKHIAGWKQLFEGVQPAVASLRKAVADNAGVFEHSAHAARFREINSRLRAVEDALSTGDMLLAAPTAKPSLATSVAPSPVERGPMSTPVKVDGIPLRRPLVSADDAADEGGSAGQPAFGFSDVAEFSSRTNSTLVAASRAEHRRSAQDTVDTVTRSMYGIDKGKLDKLMVHTSETKPAKRVKSPLKRLSEAESGAAAARVPGSPGSAVFSPPPQDQTIIDVLRRMFQYFTTFGDRRNTQYMTDFKFYKLMRIAKVTDKSFTERDIDQVYTKTISLSHNVVVADGVKRPGATATGRRMNFDEFILAVAEIANRKFGDTMAPPEAFKELFVRHMLPMKERFSGMAPLGLESVLPAGEDSPSAFLDRLCQPEVLSFFNENRESIQALFLRFAMDETPSGALTWESVRDLNATMSEKEFVKFCSSMNLMPFKINRPDCTAVFRRATQEFAEEGVDESLSYPEFVEVLASLAEYIYRFEESNLLQKLLSLFLHMSDSGFKFSKREWVVFQNVRRIVKTTLQQRIMSQSDQAHKEMETKAQTIKDVLHQRV